MEVQKMTMDTYSIMYQVDKKLSKFASEANLAHRTALIDSTLNSIEPAFDDTDLHYDLKLSIRNKSKAKLIRLGVLSWYLPETHGILLRLELEKLVGSNSDLFELEFILKTKNQMKVWLKSKLEVKGTAWLFGNFLNKNDWSGKSLLEIYSIKKIRNHKRYSDQTAEQRYIGVGYKDKGSRPKDARGGFENFMLTRLHNEIMQRRSETETLKLIFEGFML